MTTQPALFPSETRPAPVQRTQRALRVVPAEVFVAWYLRTFRVDLGQCLINQRTVEATVQQQPRLRLERTEGVRPDVDRFVLRVGSFGCELAYRRAR